MKAYKSRTFDEEITGIENQEGKFTDSSRQFVVVQYLNDGSLLSVTCLFWCAGTEGISNKLKVELSRGISGDSFPARTLHFGNNNRPPLKAKTFCKIFFEALDDFMLKVLIVAATLSLVCEYIAADPDHYSTGKYLCQSLGWADSSGNSGSR